MRHRKSGRQLNRNSSHRQAMFKNMTASLVEHEIIKTTLPTSLTLIPTSSGLPTTMCPTSPCLMTASGISGNTATVEQ